MSASTAIAEKHVHLSTRIKQIAESKGYAGHVFIATHAVRRSAPTYRQAEQDRGGDFWSIKAWTSTSQGERNLKDPDLIIIDKSRVKLLVEVKWGTVSGNGTDLEMGLTEAEEIKDLLEAQSVYCNVNGPVSEPPALRQHKKFWLDGQTRFVLVTDIPANPELHSLFDAWTNSGLTVTDIEKRVGSFMPFLQLLEAQK